MNVYISNDPPSNSREAFTFVELLVVVAVVVVMAGMLIPVLGASKNKSAAAGCLGNLRQMQNAWSMYLDDNHDIMLPNAPGGTPNNAAWCAGSESWLAVGGNTNLSLYTYSLRACFENVLFILTPSV